MESKDKWLLLSASFTTKFVLVFVLTLENAFSQRFYCKANRDRAQVLLKNSTRDFQNSSPFKRSACFYVTISGNCKRFQYTLTLKQIFWKTKAFFKKLECRFLVESTLIGNSSFSYKTTISEANVKTHRMVSTKWTYH